MLVNFDKLDAVSFCDVTEGTAITQWCKQGVMTEKEKPFEQCIIKRILFAVLKKKKVYF